jgi:hypothetical protein
MDILAHALWAGIGTTLAARRFRLTRRTVVATIALAVVPDVVQLLPIAAWVMSGGGAAAALVIYATASPGSEPAMPAAVGLVTHHLHCVTHSAIIAGAVTLLTWIATRSLWVPLLGWWSHILIDVVTHSAEFYPSPVLYPLTLRGFDGIAWNTPWFMALNYAALGVALMGVVRSRSTSRSA